MDKSKIEHLNKQEYTHLPHAEQEFENHEQTDVAIRPLVATLVAIAAVLVFSYLGIWGLFELFKTQTENAPDNQRLTAVEARIRQVPDGLPALQGVPAAQANPRTAAQDMDLLRQRNALVMKGEQPMRDGRQQPGMRPGMPIERAMEEAMERKIFKVRSAETAGASGAAASGGEASGAPGAGQQR
jgi:hypothetical protein